MYFNIFIFLKPSEASVILRKTGPAINPRYRNRGYSATVDATRWHKRLVIPTHACSRNLSTARRVGSTAAVNRRNARRARSTRALNGPIRRLLRNKRKSPSSQRPGQYRLDISNIDRWVRSSPQLCVSASRTEAHLRRKE